MSTIEDESFQKELEELMHLEETKNRGDEWLETNESVETVSALEMFAEQLQRVSADPYRWKWAIIALHNGLQGMMTLALRGSHGLHVLSPKHEKEWLEAYEQPPDSLTRKDSLRGAETTERSNRLANYSALHLDDFLNLYSKIKGDKMLMYMHSKKFVPKGAQGDSVKLLNRLRNKFIHFTPKIWALELKGLPAMTSDCLAIAEFLAWKSNNILWRENDLTERLKAACISARMSLDALPQKKRDG